MHKDLFAQFCYLKSPSKTAEHQKQESGELLLSLRVLDTKDKWQLNASLDCAREFRTALNKLNAAFYILTPFLASRKKFYLQKKKLH